MPKKFFGLCFCYVLSMAQTPVVFCIYIFFIYCYMHAVNCFILCVYLNQHFAMVKSLSKCNLQIIFEVIIW